MIMKNYKYILIVCGLFFLLNNLNGQARYFDERYITTQHFINPVIINPGAVGGNVYHQIIGNYRNKWSTFPGAPKSYILSYDGPIGNRLGFGAMLVSDNNGALQTTKGQGTLSYTINTDTNKIGFGVSGEYIDHTVESGLLNDPFTDSDDPTLLGRLDGVRFFDVSFGIYGEYANSITYGLVLPGLASSQLDGDEGNFETEFSYIAHAGYIWDVEGYDLTVEPAIFVKQLQYVPLHLDISVLMKFLDEKLLGGISYTVGADERLGFALGTRVNGLNFSYTYNISRHDFQSYNNGSHEISVKLQLGRTDKKDMMDEAIEVEEMENIKSTKN